MKKTERTRLTASNQFLESRIFGLCEGFGFADIVEFLGNQSKKLEK